MNKYSTENRHDLLKHIDKYYEKFGDSKSIYKTKAIGAITNETIRDFLCRENIEVSCRDVFIYGLPTEWDLIIPKRGTNPDVQMGCLWQPENVAGIVEIKYSGLYDQNSIQRLKSTFTRLTSKYPHIQPFYFTVMESASFQERVTDQTLGYPAFTLHWYKRLKNNDTYQMTEDWGRFVTALQALQIKL